MPLQKGKSKSAFNHNVEAEMQAGKPQDQSLAIAYSVKRKAKKKMAEGGEVKSASNESRPSTEETNNDRHEVARQGAAKAITESQWDSRPDIKQSQGSGMKVTKIKHPKMVGSDVVQARLRDEEDDLQTSAGTNEGKQEQPRKVMDEEDATKSGNAVNKQDGRHISTTIQKQGHTRDRNMQAVNSPSEDEGYSDAMSKEEEGQNRQGPAESSTQGKSGKKPTFGLDMYAEGGHVPKDEADEIEVIPDKGFGKIIRVGLADGGEVSEERANSIAAAIMTKLRHGEMDSDSDEDIEINMFEGGEITRHSGSYNGEDSLETHEDEDQVDLRRNAEEDANMEDQSSYDAMRKENYSESEGLSKMSQPTDSNETGDEREHDEEDEHDMVSQIRRKMKSRRQMPQE